MAQAETQQSAKTSFSKADKIIKCVNALGNQFSLVHSIGAQRTKSQFDALSADQFLKWLAELDIYLEVDRDEKQSIWLRHSSSEAQLSNMIMMSLRLLGHGNT